MTCSNPKCGIPIKSGWLVCPNCGTPLPKKQLCECGSEITAGWKVCPFCGRSTTRLKTSVCRLEIEPKMVLVRGGSFQMGDEFGEIAINEHDYCMATLANSIVDDFYIGKYLVTRKEYSRFCDETGKEKPEYFDSFGHAETCPVTDVSWYDAMAYCEWLSAMTGRTYRLPTEHEWEYAARGGGKSEKWAGVSDEKQLDEYAWYEVNSGQKLHPVGQKKPNSLGIYDMSGNAYEWCADDCNYDFSDEVERVIRGGSYINASIFLRVSYRYCNPIDEGDSLTGFRCARDVEI